MYLGLIPTRHMLYRPFNQLRIFLVANLLRLHKGMNFHDPDMS
jgi:hypothetical protein